MELSLSTLTTVNRRKKKRVGRGNGSGIGTYSGRGLKGQKARTGGHGGLQRRAVQHFFRNVPKHSEFKGSDIKVASIKLSDLSKNFPANFTVTLAALIKKGVVARGSKAKILGGSKLSHVINIKGLPVTVSAREAIIAIGGKVSD